MTEKEKIMYKIMGSIYEEDIPLVFKGALITKLILMEHDNLEMERVTKDIDANWVDKKPTMEYLNTCINNVVQKINPQFSAIPIRNYTETQSAGIKIIDKNKNEIISIDIKISPITHVRTYYYGNLSFNGVEANQILCDKISSVSSNKILRRVKDIIDIYALSQCISLNVSDIISISKSTGREIYNFEVFINNTTDIKYAYNKLRGIKNKPQFDELYKEVYAFLSPFINKIYDLNWDNRKQEWRFNESNITHNKKSSLLKRLNEKKKEVENTKDSKQVKKDIER